MIIPMVVFALSETEEAEEFVWDTGNLESRNRIFVCQVVVVSTINFHQEVLIFTFWDIDHG